jgi:hypothetical protein
MIQIKTPSDEFYTTRTNELLVQVAESLGFAGMLYSVDGGTYFNGLKSDAELLETNYNSHLTKYNLELDKAHLAFLQLYKLYTPAQRVELNIEMKQAG